MIENNIKQAMNMLNIDRMPTRQEIIDTVGNPTACKITKTHGYYGWAKKLGIPVKNSDSTIGRDGELEAMKILVDKGYTVEKMSTNYPFDLFVNKSVKVDVKYSHLYHGRQGNFYSFKLNKIAPTCDFYLLIANDKDTEVYVVPSNMAQQTQISIGEVNSVWHKYKDRFDLLDKYIQAVETITSEFVS